MTCPNARLMIYIDPWVTDSFVEKEKEFKVSFLRGSKNFAMGHKLRHEVFANRDRLVCVQDFYESMVFDKEIRQACLFSDSQYNICIENSRHNNYFTEKILDCFLTKTIPIYWGCPNIHTYFDSNGILIFNSISELDNILLRLTEDTYRRLLFSVENNYMIAKDMVKDIGFAGYNILNKKIDELLVEKYGSL